MAREPGADDPDAGTTDPDRRAIDPSASPDDIFADFVRKANADWVRSVEAVLSELEQELEEESPPIDREGTDRIVLLTSKKSQPPPPAAPAEDVTVRKRAIEVRRKRKRTLARATEDWASVVPQPGDVTQRREAAKLVPYVASVAPPEAPAPEGSEDGLVPGGELDRKLADMDVLVRYGHAAQVQSELETLRLTYPHDLLLLRRIAELYVKHRLRGPALDALFTLATGLFERRNVEGMRQALEQVIVLDPGNQRAMRLVALLEQRPSAPPPRPSSPPRPPGRSSPPGR